MHTLSTGSQSNAPAHGLRAQPWPRRAGERFFGRDGLRRRGELLRRGVGADFGRLPLLIGRDRLLFVYPNKKNRNRQTD